MSSTPAHPTAPWLLSLHPLLPGARGFICLHIAPPQLNEWGAQKHDSISWETLTSLHRGSHLFFSKLYTPAGNEDGSQYSTRRQMLISDALPVPVSSRRHRTCPAVRREQGRVWPWHCTAQASAQQTQLCAPAPQPVSLADRCLCPYVIIRVTWETAHEKKDFIINSN